MPKTMKKSENAAATNDAVFVLFLNRCFEKTHLKKRILFYFGRRVFEKMCFYGVIIFTDKTMALRGEAYRRCIGEILF